MERVHFFLLWVEVILDDLYKNVDEAGVVDLVEVTVVETFVLVFQLDLSQQEVVLDVLLQHLLREISFQFVSDDLCDLLQNFEEISDDYLFSAHGEADFFLDGGDVCAGE